VFVDVIPRATNCTRKFSTLRCCRMAYLQHGGLCTTENRITSLTPHE